MKNILPHIFQRPVIIIIALLMGAKLCAQINTEQVTLMGRHALYFDDYLTAIRYFNKVIETKPYLDKPYYYRAYAKFSLEDFLGAEADCDLCLERNPYLTDVYQLRGLSRIHNKDMQGAIADYQKVLTDRPLEQTARYNRALCYLEEKQYAEAEADIIQLLKQAPRNTKAYLVRSQLRMLQSDTLGAIIWADSLLSITKRDAIAWNFRGKLALATEDYTRADSCLTQAIKLDDNNADHYMMRAQARHAINRFDEAVADYNTVIDFIPHHFVAHYNRGLLLATIGRDNDAIADFDYVLAEEPTNTLARYNRALLLERTGDYAGAINDITMLIKDYPNFVYGYSFRAECRHRIGDVRGAQADEAFVQRASLDLRYGKKTNLPTRKVITRTEKSLENYQQLVEEADTTNFLLNELIGKVQNLAPERTPLGLIRLVLSDVAQSEYFLPEVGRLNAKRYIALQLVLTASQVPQITTSVYDRALQTTQTLLNDSTQADALLLRSIIQAQRYNFTDATDDVSGVLMTDSTSVCAVLHQCVLHFQMAQAETSDKTANRMLLTASLDDAQRLISLTERAWAPAFYNYAVIAEKLGMRSEAMQHLDTAIRLEPHLSQAYFNRALLYLDDGQTEKATLDLSKAGELGIYKSYSVLKSVKNK